MPGNRSPRKRSRKGPFLFVTKVRLWHRREMTTPLISLTCKHCGQSLTAAATEPGAQPCPGTVFSCPVHGPIGTLKDLVIAAAEEFIGENERVLGQAGMSVTRERRG
jgi:hypothetical protein